MSAKIVIYLLLLFAGLLTGASQYRRLSFPYRVLFFTFVYIFVKEAGALILSIYFDSNLTYYRYLGIIDSLLVAWIFYLSFERNWMRQITIAASIFMVAYFCLHSLRIKEPVLGLDTDFRLIRGVILVIFALFGYFQILKSMETHPLFQLPFFWFTTGVLVFYSVSIFYWGFLSTFQQTLNGVSYFKIVRGVFEWGNYLMYLMFLISLRKDAAKAIGKA